MVTKKYLASAPRPEHWEEHANAILKGLGKDNEHKRDELLRQTLQGLKAVGSYEKRTGPGRKSNAEHAIAFYEYMLGETTTTTTTNQEEEEEYNDEDEDEEEMFLNQHNDLCDVCETGGELLCCSTCNLVFHLQCLHPPLKQLPEGDWGCPHCVLASAKKQSKSYKAALEAVEAMKKTGKKEGGNNSTKEETKAEEQKEYSSLNEKDVEDDGKERNNQGEPSPPTQSEESISTPDTSGGRGRRARRQPILYNPQIGPDSKWKSDGLHWDVSKDGEGSQDKTISGDESSSNKSHSLRKRRRSADDPEDTKAEATDEKKAFESTAEETKPGTKSPLCNFCNDDPNIPICVFCACRICFGKHDKDKLLLCDKCDDEYHTYCLKLSAVPSAETWFCPTCTNAAKDSTEAKNSTSPNKISTATRSSTTPKKTSDQPSTPKPTTSDGSPLKRPRGRPPKNNPVQSPPPAGSSPNKRPRGRPPKTFPAASSTQQSPPQVPRKRGRPPKTPQPAVSPVALSARKKASPKPSSSSKVTIPNIESSQKKPRLEEPTPEPEPIKISRSGRIVKRSSFHDEMEEGEQHLRSTQKGKMEEKSIRQEIFELKKKKDITAKPAAPRGSDNESDGEALPVRTKKLIHLPGSGSQESSAGVEKVVQSKPVPAIPATISTAPGPTVSSEVIPKTAHGPFQTKEQAAALSEKISGPESKTEVLAASSSVSKKETPSVPRFPNETLAGIPESSSALAKPATEPSKKVPVSTLKPVEQVKVDVDVEAMVKTAISNIPTEYGDSASNTGPAKAPRRKPGARECMQISRRFGNRVIPKKHMDTLYDYCSRGKVEHLIRMRERLDEHARYLESQLAGLEMLVRERGASEAVVPPLPERLQLDSIIPLSSSKSLSPATVPGSAPFVAHGSGQQSTEGSAPPLINTSIGPSSSNDQKSGVTTGNPETTPGSSNAKLLSKPKLADSWENRKLLLHTLGDEFLLKMLGRPINEKPQVDSKVRLKLRRQFKNRISPDNPAILEYLKKFPKVLESVKHLIPGSNVTTTKTVEKSDAIAPPTTAALIVAAASPSAPTDGESGKPSEPSSVVSAPADSCAVKEQSKATANSKVSSGV